MVKIGTGHMSYDIFYISHVSGIICLFSWQWWQGTFWKNRFSSKSWKSRTLFFFFIFDQKFNLKKKCAFKRNLVWLKKCYLIFLKSFSERKEKKKKIILGLLTIPKEFTIEQFSKFLSWWKSLHWHNKCVGLVQK